MTTFYRHGDVCIVTADSMETQNVKPKKDNVLLEGEGVWIAATEAGKQKRIDEGWRVSTTGSAEALLDQLDPEGKLKFIRASKAMLQFLKRYNLFGLNVAWEWLSDYAASGSAWLGCAQRARPYASVARSAYEDGGVRALRDVTGECS